MSDTPCYYCELDRATYCKVCIHGEADPDELFVLVKQPSAQSIRDAALEEAAGVCDDKMAPPSVGSVQNAVLYHEATLDCAAAIRAKKGQQ